MKEKNYNRRKFLKASVVGSAAAFMGTRTIAMPAQNKSGKVLSENIITRKLGKTGIELPIVSMGVMRADNPALVKAALQKGILHLDTAHTYQGGRNEEMLGKLLKDYPRDSYIISTKVKIDGFDRETGKFSPGANPEEIIEKLDISLNRLNTDHVDILYMHGLQSAEAVTNKEVLKYLEKAKKSGKARFTGVSTHRNMPEVINAVTDSNFYDIVLTSYNFQLADSAEMESALQKADAAGIGIIAMKTMAGGFLDKDRTRKVNAKAALKWALRNKNIHTSIPGYTSFEELEESFSVMADLEMNEQEKKDLQLSDVSSTLFCEGCETCVYTCKYHLNIPDYMRAYMYTYGYHEYAKAQDVLLAQDVKFTNVCDECGICTASCKKGFNIAGRIYDVSRLTDVPKEFFT